MPVCDALPWSSAWSNSSGSSENRILTSFNSIALAMTRTTTADGLWQPRLAALRRRHSLLHYPREQIVSGL